MFISPWTPVSFSVSLFNDCMTTSVEVAEVSFEFPLVYCAARHAGTFLPVRYEFYVIESACESRSSLHQTTRPETGHRQKTSNTSFTSDSKQSGLLRLFPSRCLEGGISSDLYMETGPAAVEGADEASLEEADVIQCNENVRGYRTLDRYRIVVAPGVTRLVAPPQKNPEGDLLRLNFPLSIRSRTLPASLVMPSEDHSSSQDEAHIPRAVTDISLPTSLHTIGNRAFGDCVLLTSIHLSESVTTISQCAFEGCRNLQEVQLPDQLRSIGRFAFCRCSSLREITLPENLESIVSGAFAECSSLVSVSIPHRITDIPARLFQECSSLRYCILHPNLHSIGTSAFYNCSALEKIALLRSLQKVESSAFYGCEMLQSVDIPDGITHLPSSCFHRCTRLQSVRLSSSLEIIGSCGFGCCSSLKQVELPPGLTSIEHAAFLNCHDLATIEIPDSVTMISHGAFEGCSSLTSIHLPPHLISLSVRVYKDCSGLHEVRLPQHVETIAAEAFSGCYHLSRVILSDNLHGIALDAFASCPNLQEVHVPDSFAGWITLESLPWNCRLVLPPSIAHCDSPTEEDKLAWAQALGAANRCGRYKHFVQRGLLHRKPLDRTRYVALLQELSNNSMNCLYLHIRSNPMDAIGPLIG